jgi:DNA-binding transcriptional ArsR family regulator
MDGDANKKHADMFGALGHSSRLGVVRLLVTAHPRGLHVGDLQEKLGVPSSTLSHHLDTLRNAGLVTQQRERQHLLCRVDPEGFRELLSFFYAECTRTGIVSPAAMSTRVTR